MHARRALAVDDGKGRAADLHIVDVAALDFVGSCPPPPGPAPVTAEVIGVHRESAIRRLRAHGSAAQRISPTPGLLHMERRSGAGRRHPLKLLTGTRPARTETISAGSHDRPTGLSLLCICRAAIADAVNFA